MGKAAEGIPDRENYGDTSKIPLNTLLTYVDQLHEARRAGTHHDIRFGDRELFSWAGRRGLPAPGERAGLFQQPLHSPEYANFEGEIPEGYGAGRVTTHDKGNVTVTEAGPDKIKFTLTHKEPLEHYTMIRTEGKGNPWLTINQSQTKQANLVVSHNVHGDEPAGEIAAKKLESQGIERLDAGNHTGKRRYCGIDLNRHFGESRTTDQNKKILEKLRAKKPTLLVDLHENSDANGAYAYTTPELKNYVKGLLKRRNSKLPTALEADGDRTDEGVITDGKHPGRGALVSAARREGIPYILLETPSNEAPLKVRADYQRQIVEEVHQDMKRAEENNTSIDYLKDTAIAAGAHRLGDSALTYGVRRGGLFQNYYANVAKEGVNAALSGKDVMPQWRRALGIISPSLTGLTDYEVSRGLTHKLLYDLKNQGITQNPNDLKALLKQHPQVFKHLQVLKKSPNLSPITRNIVNASDPALPKNKFVEFLKTYGGVGVDRQKNPALVGGTLAGLTGAAHGLTGAAGGLISASPDLMFGVMGQNKDLIKNLEEMKLGIIGAGTLARADTPLKSKFISGGLNAISPSSGEIYDLGQDLSQPLDNLPTEHKKVVKKFIGENIISPGKTAPLRVLKNVGKIFKLGANFAPDYTPEDLQSMGVFDEVYARTKPRLASLNTWPQHWFHPEDKMGWLEWYEKYSGGRRMEDDERQIGRWKAFRARHGGKAFQENPTPRRAYALRNWGIDPVKLLNDEEKRVKLTESMKTYRDKKYEKVAGEYLATLRERLSKTSSSSLDGLVTSQDLKSLKKYVLTKNELREPRELSPEEKKTVAFRKRVGWSFFNPLYDIKPRDVAQQIQNPVYRAIGDTIGSGVLNSVVPLTVGALTRASSFYGVPGSTRKLTSNLFLGMGLAGGLSPFLGIKHKIDKQLLYNRIAEEYMRHHQEGSITTMDSILKDMTAKKRAPQSLKLTKRKVKTGSFALSSRPDSFKEKIHSVLGDIDAMGPAAIFAAARAPFNLWGDVTAYSRGKKEINDLRERFERKLREKAEAEAFVEKVKMPLYKHHHGVTEKMEKFDELFKESAETSPLLPHQARAIEKLKQPDQPGLILMHGLGSGKTRSSIEAYRELGMPAEVVLPAALRENYVKELKKWLGKHPKDVNIQSQQLIARKGANPEDFEGKLMVLDEAHRMRNEDTKLFRALKEVKAKKRLLLTGTPIYNHPSDIAKLINVAAGKTILPETRPEFEKEYIAQKVVFPSPIHRVLGVKPGQELGVKNKEYLQHVFNKMIDYHGGSDEGFPEMTYENIRVPMEREQERVYKALMKDLPWHLRMKVRAGLPPDRKELDKLLPFLSGARMISNSSEGFTRTEKARSPKIESAAQFLKDKLKEDPDYKALIYSNYLGSGVNPYKKMLDESGIPYGEFTGNVNDKLRNDLVKKYNENKLKALIISSAGGEGLDLKGTRLVQVLEPHFNNEKIKQVVGRAARYLSHSGLPKEKQNVLVQNYLSTLTPSLADRMLKKHQTSTDEYLQNLAEQKEELNNAFINLIKKSHVKVAKSQILKELIEAKKLSDKHDYVHKNEILQRIVNKNPEQFRIDSYLNKAYVGITHKPSGFKIHAKKNTLPSVLVNSY